MVKDILSWRERWEDVQGSVIDNGDMVFRHGRHGQTRWHDRPSSIRTRIQSKNGTLFCKGVVMNDVLIGKLFGVLVGF